MLSVPHGGVNLAQSMDKLSNLHAMHLRRQGRQGGGPLLILPHLSAIRAGPCISERNY